MPIRIFYSWQADLPNKTNRGLIRDALDKAVKQIETNEKLIVESDRQGVPGSPDILYTILEKIDQADLFVCDVTTIGHSEEGKPLPNPNVLFELGYAMRSLSMRRVLMVLNTAYGRIEDLPFDLKRFAFLSYHMEPDEKPADARNQLVEDLRHAIQGIHDAIAGEGRVDQPDPAQSAINTIHQNAPNAVSQMRAFMRWLGSQLKELSPEPTLESPLYPRLKKAIDDTEELVVLFAQVAQAIAEYAHQPAALALMKGFAPILEGYSFPRRQGGRLPQEAFDFYRFMGHELFVTLIALLMREGQWVIIANLLNQTVSIDNEKNTGRPEAVSYLYFSDYVEIGEVWNRSEAGNKTISWHADILKDRHTSSDIADIVPIVLFEDADYLLFLRAELKSTMSSSPSFDWRPWSFLCMGNRIPRFLIDAYQKSVATQLLPVLDVDDIEKLRQFPQEKYEAAIAMYPMVRLYRSPLDGFMPSRIGTQ
jgi:hypothetical protein